MLFICISLLFCRHILTRLKKQIVDADKEIEHCKCEKQRLHQHMAYVKSVQASVVNDANSALARSNPRPCDLRKL